ncbi:5-oxoprolinase subunit B family protein [Alteromonas halophila]|uniref:Allophanate hydrolase n=1 Tax=Alteromonas halophila TaxID=516698 RepID=A0A918MZF7_9ALTE|nr:allophanate hydrolase subunit 1 [Alteromonas halophila]GGW88924.1 allophanate hydrolase [Alteromonas halophila]
MTPFDAIRGIEPAGMDGIILYFSGDSLTTRNNHCQAWEHALLNASFAWLKDTLPAYDSLLIVFDIRQVDNHHVYHALRQLNVVSDTSQVEGKRHSLPVWYGAPAANDLRHIAAHSGITTDDVIRIHQQALYRVFAVGFAPGFAYMGEVDDRIACPRLSTPRDKVPQGAVAIADNQSAVYPQSSPGGWNLLGLCPLSMFDGSETYTARLAVGDTVTFEAIDEATYREMKDD